MLRDFFTALLPHLTAGQGAYMVTILAGPYAGEKSLWDEEGFITASHPERADYWQALDFGNGSPCRTVKAQSPQGELAVYVEPLLPPCQMVICGGGHISLPLVRLGHMLGFKMTVIDDRAFFANAKRFPDAAVYCQPFGEALKGLGDENTYFVVVTRGHQYDQECLRKILPQPKAYTGMIGSRRRVSLIKKALLEEGFAQEDLDALYSPIGLKIGAQTPEEVAVSIAAEIIQVRAGKDQGASGEYELWQKLAEAEGLPRALVTIIGRKGSAPRQVGTKMIVYADGNCFGTIGGGCVEAEARQRAISIAKDGGHAQMILDITGAEAEDEGMVCGGILKVWIEAID